MPRTKQASVLASINTIQAQSLSPADYTIVADQNLFHPERIIPPEKKGDKMSRPDVILYATLLLDNDKRMAFLEDKKAPFPTPGRGKRQVVMKKGDMLSGYVISQVEKDHIVLVKGEQG